uniref:DNA excision repair protein ERCC-6-like n=1 Tax=Oryzias sinensis TaxID=183150 RepID=A0A8C8DEX7_9TELE
MLPNKGTSRKRWSSLNWPSASTRLPKGVSFLYGLYRDGRKGGILADDMGLGKTIQVISFLSGMYDNELIKHTLLIMPTSLITNWIKEFSRWTPGMRVKEFHGASKAERTRSLEKVQRRSGVVITTYNMLLNNWQQLSSYQGKEFCWDYVILDEAHKIKNTSSKTAKSASAIPSKNRVLLTGTPVQNNLREMWALFDFACQGTLLGTGKTFKTEYENPITRAREKDATPGEKALGSRMSDNLMAIIKPYFLRRTKAEVQRNELCEKEKLLSSENAVDSGKLAFLVALLERLREEERILNNRGFKVLRLDGTITQITERERLISLFQKDRSYSVFLLTTQVGGVGITLTRDEDLLRNECFHFQI